MQHATQGLLIEGKSTSPGMLRLSSMLRDISMHSSMHSVQMAEAHSISQIT